MKIGSSSIIIGREDTLPGLEGTMKNLLVNMAFVPESPQINLTLNLEGLSVRGKLPVLSLHSLSISSKYKDNLLRITTHLINLHMTYDHRDWDSILSTNPVNIPTAHVSPRSKFPWNFIQKVNTTTDLQDGALIIRLPEIPEASCGVFHINLELNRLGSDSHDWSTKLLIESLRCTLNGLDPGIPKTTHHWGNPLSVGVLVATTHKNAVGIVMDALRTEWSPELGKFVQHSLKYFHENWKHSPIFNTPGSAKKNPLKKEEKILQLKIKVSNCNVFLIADSGLSVMTRLDFANIEHNVKERFVGVAEGVSAITLNRNDPIVCEHAERLKESFLSIRKCKGAITSESVSISLNASSLVWSPNLHLRILQLWKESSNFRKVFSIDSTSTEANKKDKEIKEKRKIDFLATGGITITVDIDLQNHYVELFSEELRCCNGEWSSSFLRGSLDMVDIIALEGMEFVRLRDCDEVRIERQNNEDFQLDWNETWAFNIESAKACFPYEHCFAEAIQNKLLSLRKWLKEIHSSGSKKSKKLPCDLVIKIKEWIFEVSDDPFEIRLRDNYELLEDEYKESLKRQAMLDAKVKELCRAHLLLPQGKVEELYASLNKKNAEIYVQRWRQMQKTGPARTRLFAWTMQDLEIIALADPVIDGIQNATAAIAEMDSESPWPEDGIEFSILWVRGIAVKCTEWKLQLRDFPQPLLLVEGLSIWGKLAGAETLAPPRARRTVSIKVGAPWEDIVVERGMTSLKYYHDLNWDIDNFR